MATEAWRLLAILVISMNASCSERESDKHIRFDDELGRRYAGSDRTRLVDLGQSALDQSCLEGGKTAVRGSATDHDIEKFAEVVRVKWPDEPVITIEVSPRLAMVMTGIDCSNMGGSGFGHKVYFEAVGDPGNLGWQVALQSNWIG